MKIYRIAINKEAKFSDWFSPSSERFEELAKGFIEAYFSKRHGLPTVGEVILILMKEDDNVSQDFLKDIAVSSLSTFRNSLQEA